MDCWSLGISSIQKFINPTIHKSTNPKIQAKEFYGKTRYPFYRPVG